MLGLLLALLPKLREISLAEYSTGAKALMQAVRNIVRSYRSESDSGSDNDNDNDNDSNNDNDSDPNSRALAQLSKLRLHGPHKEGIYEDSEFDLDIFAGLAVLPSVNSVVGVGLDLGTCFRPFISSRCLISSKHTLSPNDVFYSVTGTRWHKCQIFNRSIQVHGWSSERPRHSPLFPKSYVPVPNR